ncbi:methyltransferase [Desulfococcaceae bacterium HSG7]|nr:methyltransferase [Desulfococcaceae bacterium HSG7]
MKPNEQPPQAQLMQFIIGKWISKPVYAAAELGIADMLAEGPKSIDELALESRSHAPSLYRMMRALASVGIFSETEGKRFELTPMAECLKTGAMRSIALLFESDWSDKAWGCFTDSVKTGNTAFETAHGTPVSDWLEKNPHAAQVFNEANAIKAAGSHRAIIDVYDFAGIDKLTDVGGGTGALTVEILIANPLMCGVVADIPFVIEEARKIIRSRGLENRCETAECDFFKEIPAGSDAYLMSNILHDWPDERCVTILKNCRMAMKPESKLLIVEMIVPPGNRPSIAKLLDLEMLITTGGKERTLAEFKILLESSGFKLSRIIDTQESICVIEGVRL